MAFAKTYRAASTQTVFDLALQLKGSADKTTELMDENPEIENINSDPTGVNVAYEINNDVIQKYYISKGITVSMKPSDYYNTIDQGILVDEYTYLVQEDGYKLIM